jgi:long-chain acyl-CoA synthetase
LPESLSSLGRDPAFLEYLDGQIEQRVNSALARFEKIKRFAIVPCDFSVEGGELTPTMKVRRAVVEQKYADVIESLYLAGTIPAQAKAS